MRHESTYFPIPQKSEGSYRPFPLKGRGFVTISLKGTSINRIFIAPVAPYSDFSPEFFSKFFLTLKLADFKHGS